VPPDIRAAVRNNAGGHVNHSLFWKAMAPDAGGEPAGALADAITRDFGSFERFKTQFDQAGGDVFGSGWTWLARSGQSGKKLVILTTPGHGNPMAQGNFPILLNDVWEHAYYLKYQNRRPDYLKGWWNVVNWDEASKRFARSDDFSSVAEE
jgi:superoxide dismutase, Fe-Mn family